VDSHTDTTSTASPATMTGMPQAMIGRGDCVVIRVWLTTAAAKTAKAVAPASASEGWCSGPARNAGASEVNRPNTANEMPAPMPPAT